MSIFYGVYPKNRGVRAFLSLLRFIAQPSAVRIAHITLRGPYRSNMKNARLQNYQRIISDGQFVDILGPIAFLDDEQNSVVLEVDVGALRDFWYKPDYPGGVGHITLFDGERREEAAWVLNLLLGFDWHRRIEVTNLEKLEPKLPYENQLWHEIEDVYSIYNRFVPYGLASLDHVIRLPFAGRMATFRRLLELSHSPKFAVEELLRA